VITAAPLLTGTASADSIQLAQDVRVGPPGVRVEEHCGPAVIEEHRRPAVIEETEGAGAAIAPPIPKARPGTV
jgi:hypothetical protein